VALFLFRMRCHIPYLNDEAKRSMRVRLHKRCVRRALKVSCSD